MARYDVTPGHFRTPRGAPVVIYVREGTNDHNTAQSALNEDEYALANLRVSGLAVDIGAHIGTVSIALAMDNPGLRVIAVEPLPENLNLLHANVEANGLSGRVIPISGMGGAPGRGEIEYGWTNDEASAHHAFIGNSLLVTRAGDHKAVNVRSYPLDDLIRLYGDGEIPALVKIDCEGGEYDFLRWSADVVPQVPLLLGEWHNVSPDGATHTHDDIVDLLGPTHRVTFTGPIAGPGGFRAELR